MINAGWENLLLTESALQKNDKHVHVFVLMCFQFIWVNTYEWSCLVGLCSALREAMKVSRVPALCSHSMNGSCCSSASSLSFVSSVLLLFHFSHSDRDIVATQYCFNLHFPYWQMILNIFSYIFHLTSFLVKHVVRSFAHF